MKYAAANIPADAFPLASRNDNDGRITKYAAEALLARAYLYYTGYYGEENEACTKADAVAAINDVVEKGGYELEPVYKNLWMPSAGISKETITEGAMVRSMLGKLPMQVSGIVALHGRLVRVIYQKSLCST